MTIKHLQSRTPGRLPRTSPRTKARSRLYNLLACRAHTVIMLGALFCTLTAKFFHSYRINLLSEYPEWILADISVLLTLEVILAIICFCWPSKWTLRTILIIAAIICTWSVINAGWLIRTGTQILPSVLLSLFRDPLNILELIGVNLAKMPGVSIILLTPSAIALAFFFLTLAKPIPPAYNRKLFINRIIISIIIIIITTLANSTVADNNSSTPPSAAMRYNCQAKAITSFLDNWDWLDEQLLENSPRILPYFDQPAIQLTSKLPPKTKNYNIVIVILEGVQYRYTSLAETSPSNLTPYLATLANQAVEFTNARSSLPHTTKALFALLTGQFPSASQDLTEAVPSVKSYASIATILKKRLNFRTAFFQSAKGSFEARPGLIYNLGFDKFFSRENLTDSNGFLGYLACDEFLMLKPIIQWIKANQSSQRPFFLTILCSVTHDPYEVPQWFAQPANQLEQRYRQAISYTDRFLAALDAQLDRLNLTDNTIFCVIADHGEAFGEHGLFGHERIAFEEVLRIPWLIRAPGLIKPATKVTQPVSSVDLTPTLLALLGFQIPSAFFDGINALGPIPSNRKVYFSGWMEESPAGFVKGHYKFIYNPLNKEISVYDLNRDPFELTEIELTPQQARQIANEIIAWRRNTIFRTNPVPADRKLLFDAWLCRWTNRLCWAKYLQK